MMQRMPAARRNLVIGMLVPPLVGAMVMLALGVPIFIAMPIALILFIVFRPIMLASMRRQITNMLSDTPGFLGEHTITIGPGGFREETVANNSFTKWLGVTDIVENPDYIFFFIETHIAHVIPRRAFHSIEDSGDFVEVAGKFWKEAAAI